MTTDEIYSLYHCVYCFSSMEIVINLFIDDNLLNIVFIV